MHQHALDGCDLIMCWRHNWPECPVVVELEKLMGRVFLLMGTDTE